MRGVWSLVGMLLLLGGEIEAQRVGTGSISGHVYSAETNQPLRFATVTLQPAGQGGGGGGTATTDLDGAYLVSGVQPGWYAVVGRMPGYMTQVRSTGEADAVSGTGAAAGGPPTVRVEENQVQAVELRLERGGTVGGVVRFEDGSPAEGVDVRLYSRVGEGAWQPYTVRGGYGGGAGGRTDDRGRYRIAGLTSGLYAVEVSLPVTNAPQTGMYLRATVGPRPGPGQTLRVYSGNVFRVKQAVGVELRGAEERTDMDVQIPLTGLHTVRGAVDAASSGRSVGQGTVRLLDPEDHTVVRETQIGPGGSFAIDNVPTGTYLVHVEGRPDRREAQGGGSYAPAEQSVVVDGEVSVAFTLQSTSQ